MRRKRRRNLRKTFARKKSELFYGEIHEAAYGRCGGAAKRARDRVLDRGPQKTNENQTCETFGSVS